MKVTQHASERARERGIDAREILLTRRKPQKQWRSRNGVVRERNGVVIVTSDHDELITCYRRSA